MPTELITQPRKDLQFAKFPLKPKNSEPKPQRQSFERNSNHPNDFLFKYCRNFLPVEFFRSVNFAFWGRDSKHGRVEFRGDGFAYDFVKNVLYNRYALVMQKKTGHVITSRAARYMISLINYKSPILHFPSSLARTDLSYRRRQHFYTPQKNRTKKNRR